MRIQINLKKLVTVFGLTGVGQALSIVFTFMTVSHLDSNKLKTIASIDSYYLIVNTVISLGITQYYARDIAKLDNWKIPYFRSITLRFSVAALLLIVGSILYFITPKEEYIVLLIAPLVALNSDYALYAKGDAVLASVCTLVRVALPYAAISLILLVFNDLLPIHYILTLVLFLLISSVMSVYKLGIGRSDMSFKIDFKELKKILGMGIATSLYNVFRNVIILVAVLFWSNVDLATIFAFVKLYLVYFGVRRTVVQVFFKEIVTDSAKADRVNQLIFGLTLFSAIAILFFGELLLSFFVDVHKVDLSILKNALAFVLFCNAFFSTHLTRLLARKKDRQYILLGMVLPALFVISIYVIGTLHLTYYYIFILLGVTDFLAGFLSYRVIKDIE